MLDLLSAFEDFSPELDVLEPIIDTDFITDFLLPYFGNLPRAELAAKVDEVISLEQIRTSASMRCRERPAA